MTQGARKGMVMLLTVLIVVGSALFFLVQMAPVDSPVVIAARVVPEMVRFSLVDHNGDPVNQGDYLGRNLLIFFGFTNCPQICPTTLAMLGKSVDLVNRSDRGMQKAQILFVSVDPGRDSPPIIKQYVSHFPGQIVGLTGTADQIAAVTAEFRVHYLTEKSAADSDYSVTHSELVYLVSETGRYITHLKANTDVELLASRIQHAVSAAAKQRQEAG